MTEPAKTEGTENERTDAATIPAELLEKLQGAKSADELSAILADDELENVAGGCGGDSDFTSDKCCPSCGSANCTFTNEKVYAQNRHTFDGHCNSCGRNFTYVIV